MGVCRNIQPWETTKRTLGPLDYLRIPNGRAWWKKLLGMGRHNQKLEIISIS